MPESKGFEQARRQIRINTPVGKDKILIEKIDGREYISKLFEFELDLYAQTDEALKFEQLLGQSVTIELESGDVTRYFNGLVSKLKGGSPQNSGVSQTGVIYAYRAQLVPEAWLLTKVVQSRIFQHISVPDILKKVFTGLSVSYKMQGTYEERDYCVQYRESDYHFAARLMEEEGIFFYFTHADGKHEMVVTDSIQSFSDIDSKATNPIRFADDSSSALGAGERVHVIDAWTKSQEIRSGKVTLWDHCFELPNKNLEAVQKITPTIKSGTITHKLADISQADSKLEIYDYPGEYAQRFDGIDAGGGEQASKLQKIFDDNLRTVKIRMEAEATQAVTILGQSTCQFLLPGHKFKIEGHEDGDGEYVCVETSHQGDIEGAYSENRRSARLFYRNAFECLPAVATYRPPRVTPKPTIKGSQTAIVVGPEGQEIFTDKYGRVKVQFHWDREGKLDQNSSCWIRVATLWAGKQWGVIHTPRIGQEVVVDFIEGDPDQPIIVGSVYNAEQMPPFALPDNMTQSGMRSRSTLKGDENTFNELRFEDLLDKEHIYFHAQKDMERVVENQDKINIGFGKDSKGTEFKGSQFIDIFQDRTTKIHEGNESLEVTKGTRTVVVEGDDTWQVKTGNRSATIDKGNDTLTISEGSQTVTITKGDQTISISGGNMTMDVNKDVTITADNVTVTAQTKIVLEVGSNNVTISSSGVDITGTQVNVTADSGATVDGGTSASLASLSTEVSGDGTCKISGGLVKIN